MECDLTDDVSALSMDGASAIAGMGLAKRLRKDFAKMQMGIPEDEEQQGVAAAAAGKKPHKSDRERRKKDGEELLEPFPKTYEEWQKKKEKKHKHKSKKHHKKSIKSGSRSSKNREQQHMENIGEKSSLPIMEISIQSTNFQSTQSSASAPSPARRRSDDTENASDLRSASSIASTADTSRSRSGIAAAAAATTSSSQQQHYPSFTGGGAMGMAIKRSLLQSHQQSSFRSTRSSADSSHASTHLTGEFSQSHQSHVTVEDLQQLQSLLECAKMEEKQVLDIYSRLGKEVQSAKAKAERYKSHQQTICLKLEAASSERECLQQELVKIYDENIELHANLRHLEEREADKGLDDVLDSMESKIKELKVRSKRSKGTPKGTRSLGD